MPEWVDYTEAMHTYEPVVLLEIEKPLEDRGCVLATISEWSYDEEEGFEVKYHLEDFRTNIMAALRETERFAGELGVDKIGVRLEQDNLYRRRESDAVV